jgi:hypothetical protein
MIKKKVNIKALQNLLYFVSWRGIGYIFTASMSCISCTKESEVYFILSSEELFTRFLVLLRLIYNHPEKTIHNVVAFKVILA